MTLTPDGRYAISASDDYTLGVWDRQSEGILTLHGHKDKVRAVTVTSDGRYIISASADRTLKVWDLHLGCVVHTLHGHTDSVTAVAVIPNSHCAISSSDDHSLIVWDLWSGQALTAVTLDNVLWGVAVAPDGATILTGDMTGNVYCLRYVG